jgi:hypothetical protein
MAANVHLQSIDLSATWKPLAESSLVLRAWLIAAAGNAAHTQLRVNGGAAAKYPAGATVELEGVDLSTIEVKGNTGDLFVVVGTSR